MGKVHIFITQYLKERKSDMWKNIGIFKVKFMQKVFEKFSV